MGSVLSSSGVYKIEHIASGRMYIGSAINLGNRLSRHKSDLNNGRSHNKILQNSWNRYGDGAFIFDPILICSKEDRVFYEQLIMDKFRTYEKPLGFNIRKIAESNEGVTRVSRMKGIPIKSKPGDKYGRVTLMRFLEIRKRHHIWELKCDCGREFTADVQHLRIGRTKGCGCSPKNRMNSGLRDNPMYHYWTKTNPRCDAWKNFKQFISDVGNRPDGCYIDRVNKNAVFSKENFVWMPYGTTARCKMIIFNGASFNLSMACRMTGILYGSVWNYMKKSGKTHQEAFDWFIQKKDNKICP